MNKAEILYRMRCSKITLIRTHGSPTGIEASDAFLSKEELLDLPSGSLGYCELVIYGACETGMGRQGADNFVNATHNRGRALLLVLKNGYGLMR